MEDTDTAARIGRHAGAAGRDAGTAGQAPAPVVVDRITKTYGATVAVNELSLKVSRASITALVGPNGAGKTTVVECIEGLCRPDQGSIRVLGLDPVRDRVRIYQRVGVHLQESAMHARLRVIELLRLFASLYQDPEDENVLITRFGLEASERTRFERLSGGQKRRLLVALALIGRPELVILDEPTTGLDPQARRDLWAALEELRRAGLTVLVTTHYLEEAEDHCDQVVMIDEGRTVATGSPADLLERYGLGVRVTIPASLAPGEEHFAQHQPLVTHVERVGDDLLVYGRDNDVYEVVVAACRGDKAALRQIELRPARLEELYLLLTGRTYRKE